MQVGDGFPLKAHPAGTGSPAAAAARPVVIEPWISAVPEVVVYEFGARLDAGSAAAAAGQILKARHLYNALIGCIRIVHTEMNAWVLERAGPRAQTLQASLTDCEREIASARAAAEVDRLHLLAPKRLAIATELTAVLRPVREAHRAELRTLYFARVGNTTATETYRLRCQAVAEGLGWATATEVLDSALLAWRKSLAIGRAPKFANADRKDQDTLTLQFAVKGGLPVERVLDGSSQDLHLSKPDTARRRAYADFRFPLGLARDGVDAIGTWQYHRPLPEGAHVSSARLVRRRVADKDQWSLQLVLRLAEPIHVQHTPTAALAAVHFGWMKGGHGRRVATIARSADPAAVQHLTLPASVEDDLRRSAELQGQRARTRAELLLRLQTLVHARRLLPPSVLAELAAVAELPSSHIAVGRIYRLHKALGEFGLWRDWFDAWVRDDRMHWQAAVLLARRARGRRRDFYRCAALQIARDHAAVVLEPLDLRAASKAVDEASGQWAAFSRHARAGRVMVALHEFEQAIRWACARHDTPVFELKGMTTRTCAACGAIGLAMAQEARQQVLCVHCGAQHERHANAACCAWRWVHEGLEGRVQTHRIQAAGQIEQTKARIEARKLGIADKRRAGRVNRKPDPQGGHEGPV